MNTTAYTPLESLLLFQSLAKRGFDAAAFAQISNDLQNNSLIRADDNYDAVRLNPEPLKELFLRLLQEELKSEKENSQKPEGGLSPTSKKRKLPEPHLTSIKDAVKHLDHLPLLVEKLYTRYRDARIRQIRDEEDRYEALQREIAELEEAERAERQQKPLKDALKPSAANGTPAVEVPKGVNKLPNGAGTSTPSPPQQPSVPGEGGVPPRQPSPEKASVTPTPALAQPNFAAQSQTQQPFPQPVAGGPGFRPIEPARSSNGAPQVLQAPQGMPTYPPRPVQATQTSATELGQRPDGLSKPKGSPVPQNAQPPTPGTLKWEPPYQPQPIPPNKPMQQPPAQRANQTTQPQHGVPAQPWGQQAPASYPSPRSLPQQSPGPAAPSGPPPQHAQSGLVPPQTAGQGQLPLQPAPMRSPSAESLASASQTRPTATGPATAQGRALQPQPIQHQGASQPPPAARLLASASPTPPPPPPSLPHGVPPHQWAQSPAAQAAQPYGQLLAPAPSPSPAAPQSDQRAYGSPYQQPPRSAIPDHILQDQRSVSTPSPAPRSQHIIPGPHTPITFAPNFQTHGSGTKWKLASTNSTPRRGGDDPESPVMEPLSPVLAPRVSPASASQANKGKQPQKIDTHMARRGRPSRNLQKQRDSASSTPVPANQGSVAQSAPSPVEEAAELPSDLPSAKIKDEEMTPRPLTEAGDTTADESVTGHRHVSRAGKRKRDAVSPLPTIHRGLPVPPTHVLWTRSFTRVSSSALEQVTGHKSANMFAKPLRETEAPGYRGIILHPQDLKSIRAAISAGNKAAHAAAAALAGGDPGTSGVWLPMSEELVPPKGIINSAQLERELVHMFANAIMYNPDPNRGPGIRFIRAEDEEDEDEHADGAAAASGLDALGYKMDENGVVKDTQAMFADVEQTLSNLRAAEIHSGAPPLPTSAAGVTTGAAATLATGAVTGRSTRHSSVATGTGPTTEGVGKEEAGAASLGAPEPMAGVEDGEATEVESTGNTAKRRRITRGGGHD